MVGLNEIENYNNNTILDDDNQTQSYDALDLHNPQHQEKHINKYSLRSIFVTSELGCPSSKLFQSFQRNLSFFLP